MENIPWRREWVPTPAFLPRESHGQRSLVGYSPWNLRVLASGLRCLLLDLECYKPWFAPPGYTGYTLNNTRVLYSYGSQCDQCPLDLCNTTAVLTFKFLRPAGHQAIISTLGLSSTLTSLSKLRKESPCLVSSLHFNGYSA